MFYLNETLDVSAAHSSGLITKIIDDEDFEKEVMSCCTKISGFSSQVRISPMFESLVSHAFRLVHESAVEKFRFDVFLDL